MPQTVLGHLKRRGRETAAWLAIVGTLAAMFLTAHQVRQGWAQRRLAAERAVRDHLTTAAVLIGAEAAKMSALELRALLWPALGTNAWRNPRPLTLDGFARAGAGQFAAMNDDRGAARPGYFRLARRDTGGWTAELRGALATDSAYARAILAEVRPWAERVDLDRPGARLGILFANVRGEPFIVGMAPERSADGHAVALFGVVYARGAALRTHVRHVLRGVPLLPAAFDGAERRAGRGAPGTARNELLAVRLLHATGARDEITAGAGGEEVWRSAFVATRAVDGRDGGFAVEVAMPDSVGRRYVEATTPLGSERLTLAGVLLLGLGFATAAAVGLRRQYKLAQARTMFVAAVSHELRTPLAHVNALSETLLLGRAESPEQAHRWLRAIHREGRRLSVLTENVLLHARGERHGVRAAPQWTDLDAVVRDAVSLVEAQAQARSARVVAAGSAAAGASGWIDAAVVRQILINLLDNALKFGPDGQTVTVALDVVRPAAGQESGGALCLTVDDEGPGVPAAHRDKVWQPFVRLAEGGSAPAGTGLGLSVVRQLVAELGGRWSVGDAPGRGARFRVELPLAAHAPPRESADAAASRARRPVFAEANR